MSIELSANDVKILQLLQHDAALTSQQIADKINMSQFYHHACNISGELYDVTHVYANSLYLGAAAFWASSLVMLPSWKLLKTKQQQEIVI